MGGAGPRGGGGSWGVGKGGWESCCAARKEGGGGEGEMRSPVDVAGGGWCVVELMGGRTATPSPGRPGSWLVGRVASRLAALREIQDVCINWNCYLGSNN